MEQSTAPNPHRTEPWVPAYLEGDARIAPYMASSGRAVEPPPSGARYAKQLETLAQLLRWNRGSFPRMSLATHSATHLQHLVGSRQPASADGGPNDAGGAHDLAQGRAGKAASGDDDGGASRVRYYLIYTFSLLACCCIHASPCGILTNMAPPTSFARS